MEIRLQCYLYALVGGGVDALQINPSRPPQVLPAMFVFVWATWMACGGNANRSEDKGSSRWSGGHFLWCQIHVPVFPSTTKEQQPWVAGASRYQTAVSVEEGSDARHPRQLELERRRPPISLAGAKRESHKIQIPKHANKAYPPDGRPGGTMTHIDGLSTSACTG